MKINLFPSAKSYRVPDFFSSARRLSGQALLEIIIGMSIGAFFITAAAVSIAAIIISSARARNIENAIYYSSELVEKVQSSANGNWRVLDDISRGSSNTYWLNYEGSSFIPVAGSESVIEGNIELGLVAHWKFDEQNNSQIFDSSGYGARADMISMDSVNDWVSGKAGNALDFDGINDFAEASSSEAHQVNGDLTITFWIYPTNIAKGQQDIISKDPSAEFEVFMKSTGALAFRHGDGAAPEIINEPASWSLAQNSWTHVTLVRDVSAGELNFYINGTNIGSATYTTAIATSTSDIRIGHRSGTSFYFQGQLDDLRIYNRALASTDVAALAKGAVYLRSFYLTSVNRDLCGVGIITTSGGTSCSSGPGSVGVGNDSSTLRLVSQTAWPNSGNGVSVSKYIHRISTTAFDQGAWRGDDWLLPAEEGPFTSIEGHSHASSSNISFSTSSFLTIIGPPPYPASAELTSPIFDTQTASGSVIHVLFWKGTLPTGTAVRFHLASSNCNNGSSAADCLGPGWTYRGPDGTSGTYYAPSGPDAQTPVNQSYHNNHRYFRYKIFLLTNGAQTETPAVDNVVIVWGR